MQRVYAKGSPPGPKFVPMHSESQNLFPCLQPCVAWPFCKPPLVRKDGKVSCDDSLALQASEEKVYFAHLGEHSWRWFPCGTFASLLAMIRLLSPFDSSTLVPSLDWIYGSQLYNVIYTYTSYTILCVYTCTIIYIPKSSLHSLAIWQVPFGGGGHARSGACKAGEAGQLRSLSTWEICVQSPKDISNRLSKKTLKPNARY